MSRFEMRASRRAIVRSFVPRWMTRLIVCFAALTAMAPSAQAQAIGTVHPGAVPCAELVPTGPCLLEVATASEKRVLTAARSLHEPGTSLWIATPAPGGTWTIRRARSKAPTSRPTGWNTPAAWVAVAIPLAAGEVLIAQDPLVVPGGATGQFEFAGTDDTGAELVGPGPQVPVTVSATVSLEPDADGDGWGDQTQDACPGLPTVVCRADGQPALTFTAPEYVPSQDDAVATWTVTNTGPSAQPFVLDFRTSARPSEITGPAGTACRDYSYGYGGGHIANWFLPVISPLVDTTRLSKPMYVTSASRRTGCVLPPLQPGAQISGEVRLKTGAAWKGTRISHHLSAHAISGGGHTPQLRTLTTRYPSGRPIVKLRPGTLHPRAIDRRGRMKVHTSCPGPSAPPGCQLRAEIRRTGGRKQLIATSAWTDATAGSQRAALTVTFSKAGRKWLRKNRSLRVKLIVTARRPRETDSPRSLTFRPAWSAGFKRAMR